MAKPIFEPTQVQTGNLVALVEAVPKGIVSKTLLDTPTVKQVLFSFDVGQELTEHRSPYTAIVHLLEGKIVFQAGITPHIMKTHDVLILPPDEPHALSVVEPSRMLLTLIKTQSA